jgi:tetratricopeptide (TPR) repeat protein
LVPSLKKSCILICIFVLTFVHPLHAQQTGTLAIPYEKPISVQDSILLKRYLDTVNSAPVFSRKRQLYFDSALAIKPWKAGWWQQKGMPLMKQGKYEVGMRYIDSAVKYNAHLYIDYRAFMKCIFQKSYRAAIEDFRASKIIIGEGSVMDHTYDFYIGLCYLQLDQLDSAAWYLSATVNEQLRLRGVNYVHPLDLFYLGIVYYEQADYQKAIDAFDRSLALYTNFSDVQYYKARCFIALNRPNEALALMKQANDNFKQGYTINEDNVIHEFYPYQVHKPIYYESTITALQKVKN